MKVVYLGEGLPKSLRRVFVLCSTRDVTNAALAEVAWEEGDVLVVNQPRVDVSVMTAAATARWMIEMANAADAIVCWFHKEPEPWQAMFAARFMGSSRLVMGLSRSSFTEYFVELVESSPPSTLRRTLGSAMHYAVRQAGVGAMRSGDERSVPAKVWRHPWFASWRNRHELAGYELDAYHVIRHVGVDDWTVQVRMTPNGIGADAKYGVVSPVGESGRRFVVYTGDELLRSRVLMVSDAVCGEHIGPRAWRLPHAFMVRIDQDRLVDALGLDIEPRELMNVGTLTDADRFGRKRYGVSVIGVDADTFETLVGLAKPKGEAIHFRDLAAHGVPADEIGTIAWAITEHKRRLGPGPLFDR